MRSIFESAIEGIVVIDDRGQIETANAALLKLLAMRRMNSSERTFLSSCRPLPRAPTRIPRELFDHRETGNYRHKCDVMAVRKDGTQLDIHISVSEMQTGPSKNIRA